jgi:hypothetical protein
MRIVALLSWYDEDPAWLKRCVESLAKVGVSDLFAADGAYELYPEAKERSSDEQVIAIAQAAKHTGIEIHDAYPVEPWRTEIAKRNFLFAWGEDFTDEQDWYMVIDADEYVLEAPTDLADQLAATSFDVGAVELIEPGHALGTMHFPTFPMFFRAIRGLRCVGEHFNYRTPDGRNLWGDAKRQQLEPRHMTGVKVMHESELRSTERRKKAQAYYRARDAAGIENLDRERFKVAT